MGYRAGFNTVLVSLSPYRLIACCAIFLVVRSEPTRQSVDTSEPPSGPQQLTGRAQHDHIHHRDTLLKVKGSLVDGATTVSDLYGCGDGNCEQVADRSDLHLYVSNIPDDIQPGYTDNLGDSRPFATDDDFESLFNDTVKILAPFVERIPDPVCREHARVFLHQLRRYKMWALQMYDSSAKLPSGVLRGNLNQLGDFDQCLSVDVALDRSDAADADVRVAGKYCLALVDVEHTGPGNGTDSLDEAVRRAQALGFIRSTVEDPGHFIPQFTSINWAVCLPASCTAESVETLMRRILAPTPGLKFTVRVEDKMCYVAGKKSLHVATYFAMFGFGVVILLAIVATIRESLEGHKATGTSVLHRVVASFSLRRNWASLIADLPGEGDIHCIHGVRAVCTVLLYAAHKIMPLALTPYSNRSQLTQLSLEPMSMVFRASLIYTDSFLMMSGVLTAYNLSKEMQRTHKIDWLRRYAARFIRLTPALLALVVFYAYVFEHLGEGPLWNKVVQTNADLCRDHLWTNILYIQNFFPFQQMCAPHTHQLALDMQLSLLCPLLVWLLHRRPAVGVSLLLALHAAAAALRFYAALHGNLSLLVYHGMPLAQLYKTANLSYSLSSHRATPYLMGVAVGHFLCRREKSLHIPQLALYLGWLVAGACAYLSVFAPAHVADSGFAYEPLEAAQYAAYSPVTWSLALGWLICACALGHSSRLNGVLSAKALVFTSRISYSFYLTQFAVFFYNVGSLRSSQQFSLLTAVSLQELAVVLLVSVLSTLLFDLPMQELKSILTGGGARSKIVSKKL